MGLEWASEGAGLKVGAGLKEEGPMGGVWASEGAGLKEGRGFGKGAGLK